MMRQLACVTMILAMTGILEAQDQPKFELPKPGPDGKIEIFNGKNLAGWYGEESVWSVEGGEIVGKSEKGLKRNEFLKSKFEVTDFRLTLKIKLVPNTANSGIQFRSVPFKGHEMKGYQADAGKGWWGKLYEESGRGILVKEDNEKLVKAEDWNTYEIVAVGNHIMMALNGVKTVDFEDPKGDKSGIFAVQVHSGGPTEVRFKDLKLELNPKAEFETVKKP